MTASRSRPSRRPRRRMVAAGVTVALALGVVSACGDDDGDRGFAATTDPAVTSTTEGARPTTSTTSTTTAPTTTTSRVAVSRTYDFTRPEVVASGLDTPWGLAFLPDGTALVAERDTGRVLHVRGDGSPPVEVAVLDGVQASGEGGLLGLAVSPTYETDGFVFAYFTSAQDNRIVRFRLGEAPQVIVDGIAKASIHNGGRLAFGPDGLLYASTGDAASSGRSQDPASLNGKILRMRPDGSPAPDNPDPNSRVWSMGHRNVQGLAWDASGRLFATEFGQNTWDEVNLIRPGGNYGWPQVEGPGDGGGAFVAPLVTWRTSESSPSGAAVVGDALYVASLRGQRLWRVPITGDDLGEPVAVIDGELGRLRTVELAPDGSLWVATSNRDGRGDPARDDDRILRFAPTG
ncbi:MAG TPA: PQQ-dependent sugar dehydrogenase [Acidimicrobiales bacterium]